MTDAISREAALALIDEALNDARVDIFDVYMAIFSMPAVTPGVKVKPGEIERAVWSAMIWAASNNAGFEGVPEYTDKGNSFAETEARAAAARILAALDLTPQPAPDVAGVVEAAKALRDLATQNTDNREEWDAVIDKLDFALAAMEGKP